MSSDRRGGERRRDGRLSPLISLAVIGGVFAATGLIARRYTPDPSHPDIQRWYKRLDKPAYKPPDPVFGAAWPVLETLHAVGAYRLMRAPQTSERDAALLLWLLNMALVAGWSKLFFGERSLTAATVEAAVLAASAAAYIERASQVDGVAAASAVPFAAWSVFGGVMTEDLRERNPELDGRD